eukprot:363807-Chlamydomonas_euryale.AAC.10
MASVQGPGAGSTVSMCCWTDLPSKLQHGRSDHVCLTKRGLAIRCATVHSHLRHMWHLPQPLARRVSSWRSGFHSCLQVHMALVADARQWEEPRVTGWRVVRWGLAYPIGSAPRNSDSDSVLLLAPGTRQLRSVQQLRLL